MSNYLRYEVIPLNEFLKEIGNRWDDGLSSIQRPNGKWVKCTGLRLRTFYRSSTQPDGLICASCKLPATHFAMESSKGQDTVHINLYGMKGLAEVLFTHDHILARALGGADDLTNSQTMCAPCNNRKSIGESKEVIKRRKDMKLMTEYDYKIEHNSVKIIRLSDNASQVLYNATAKAKGQMEGCMNSITDDQASDYFPKVKQKVIKEVKTHKVEVKKVKAPKLMREPKREHFHFTYKDGVLSETGFSPEVVEMKFQTAYKEYEVSLHAYNEFKALTQSD